MKRKQSFISVVQITERAITLLKVAPTDDGVAVVAFEEKRGPWSFEEGALQDAVTGFAAKHRLGEDHVYCILPRHDVTVRVLDLPSDDEEEIAGMIRLSAEEYVPYPLDELVISQSILKVSSNGSASVLAAIAHQDVVQQHYDLLKTAGVEPEQILLSTACLISAGAASGAGQEGCAALVNVSPGGLEALVQEDGIPVYGRGVAVAQAWTFSGDDRAASIEELVSELRQSFATHRRESADGTGVQCVFLSSDFLDVETICEELRGALGIPCQPMAAALAMVRSGREILQGIPLAGIGAALTAQGRGGCRINLMPRRVAKERNLAAVRKKSFRMAALVGIVLAVTGAAYSQSVFQRQAYIGELEKRIGAIRPRVRNVMTKRKHLQRLQQQVERQDTPLELLGELSKLAPASGMNFVRFSYQRDQGIELRGRAKELAYIHKFTDDLRGSSFTQFASAQVQYTDMANERGRSVRDFGISIDYVGGEEETP